MAYKVDPQQLFHEAFNHATHSSASSNTGHPTDAKVGSVASHSFDALQRSGTNKFNLQTELDAKRIACLESFRDPNLLKRTIEKTRLYIMQKYNVDDLVNHNINLQKLFFVTFFNEIETLSKGCSEQYLKSLFQDCPLRPFLHREARVIERFQNTIFNRFHRFTLTLSLYGSFGNLLAIMYIHYLKNTKSDEKIIEELRKESLEELYKKATEKYGVTSFFSFKDPSVHEPISTEVKRYFEQVIQCTIHKTPGSALALTSGEIKPFNFLENWATQNPSAEGGVSEKLGKDLVRDFLENENPRRLLAECFMSLNFFIASTLYGLEDFCKANRFDYNICREAFIRESKEIAYEKIKADFTSYLKEHPLTLDSDAEYTKIFKEAGKFFAKEPIAFAFFQNDYAFAQTLLREKEFEIKGEYLENLNAFKAGFKEVSEQYPGYKKKQRDKNPYTSLLKSYFKKTTFELRVPMASKKSFYARTGAFVAFLVYNVECEKQGVKEFTKLLNQADRPAEMLLSVYNECNITKDLMNNVSHLSEKENLECLGAYNTLFATWLVEIQKHLNSPNSDQMIFPFLNDEVKAKLLQAFTVEEAKSCLEEVAGKIFNHFIKLDIGLEDNPYASYEAFQFQDGVYLLIKEMYKIDEFFNGDCFEPKRNKEFNKYLEKAFNKLFLEHFKTLNGSYKMRYFNDYFDSHLLEKGKTEEFYNQYFHELGTDLAQTYRGWHRCVDSHLFFQNVETSRQRGLFNFNDIFQIKEIIKKKLDDPDQINRLSSQCEKWFFQELKRMEVEANFANPSLEGMGTNLFTKETESLENFTKAELFIKTQEIAENLWKNFEISPNLMLKDLIAMSDEEAFMEGCKLADLEGYFNSSEIPQIEKDIRKEQQILMKGNFIYQLNRLKKNYNKKIKNFKLGQKFAATSLGKLKHRGGKLNSTAEIFFEQNFSIASKKGEILPTSDSFKRGFIQFVEAYQEKKVPQNQEVAPKVADSLEELLAEESAKPTPSETIKAPSKKTKGRRKDLKTEVQKEEAKQQELAVAEAVKAAREEARKAAKEKAEETAKQAEAAAAAKRKSKKAEKEAARKQKKAKAKEVAITKIQKTVRGFLARKTVQKEVAKAVAEEAKKPELEATLLEVRAQPVEAAPAVDASEQARVAAYAAAEKAEEERRAYEKEREQERTLLQAAQRRVEAAQRRVKAAEQEIKHLKEVLHVTSYQLQEAVAFGQSQQQLAFTQGQMTQAAQAQIQYLQQVIATLNFNQSR